MEASFLSVNVPKSWQELTQKQLAYVYSLLGSNIDTDKVIFYAFMYIADLRIIKRESNDVILVRHKNKVYPIYKEDLILAAQHLDFLADFPEEPIRLDEWKGKKAVDALMHEVPFATYLEVTNYFQGYLQTQTEVCIEEIAQRLYKGYKPKQTKKGKQQQTNPTLLFNIILWLTTLNQYFSMMFPNLFQSVPKRNKNKKNYEDDTPDMRAITEAMLRALNGGDITKTPAVLEADTWGALAELDAKAREAQELERIRTK